MRAVGEALASACRTPSRATSNLERLSPSDSAPDRAGAVEHDHGEGPGRTVREMLASPRNRPTASSATEIPFQNFFHRAVPASGPQWRHCTRPGIELASADPSHPPPAHLKEIVHPMSNATLDLLSTRRSVKPAMPSAPGPSAAELDCILTHRGPRASTTRS